MRRTLIILLAAAIQVACGKHLFAQTANKISQALDSLAEYYLEHPNYGPAQVIKTEDLNSGYWGSIISSPADLPDVLYFNHYDKTNISLFAYPIKSDNSTAIFLTGTPYYLSDTPDTLFCEDKIGSRSGQFLITKSSRYKERTAYAQKVLKLDNNVLILTEPDATSIRDNYPKFFFRTSNIPDTTGLKITRSDFEGRSFSLDIRALDNTAPQEGSIEAAMRDIKSYATWRRFSIKEYDEESLARITPPWIDAKILDISISQLNGRMWTRTELFATQTITVFAKDSISIRKFDNRGSSQSSKRYYLSDTPDKEFNESKISIADRGKYIVVENKNLIWKGVVTTNVYTVWELNDSRLVVDNLRSPLTPIVYSSSIDIDNKQFVFVVDGFISEDGINSSIIGVNDIDSINIIKNAGLSCYYRSYCIITTKKESRIKTFVLNGKETRRKKGIPLGALLNEDSLKKQIQTKWKIKASRIKSLAVNGKIVSISTE